MGMTDMFTFTQATTMPEEDESMSMSMFMVETTSTGVKKTMGAIETTRHAPGDLPPVSNLFKT